jgi:hypothetical protein
MMCRQQQFWRRHAQHPDIINRISWQPLTRVAGYSDDDGRFHLSKNRISLWRDALDMAAHKYLMFLLYPSCGLNGKLVSVWTPTCSISSYQSSWYQCGHQPAAFHPIKEVGITYPVQIPHCFRLNNYPSSLLTLLKLPMGLRASKASFRAPPEPTSSRTTSAPLLSEDTWQEDNNDEND